MQRLTFLGGPGAGKGTQARRLTSRLRAVHICTGDIIRQEIESHSPRGEKARSYFTTGLLVPDELVMEIVHLHLGRLAPESGFILDGYPRTITQAQDLDILLATLGAPLDAALLLDAPDAELLARVAARRYCPSCGHHYHLYFNPPLIKGRCDTDGTELKQRSDDESEAIMARLSSYHQIVEPIQEYYQQRKLLRLVNGSGTPEEVERAILAALGAV